MISRRTAKRLGEFYGNIFTAASMFGELSFPRVLVDPLYDYLYENNYPAWICNHSRKLRQIVGTSDVKRFVQEYIMQFHTGEILVSNHSEWSVEQLEKLGQSYLFEFAQDVLGYWETEADEQHRRVYGEYYQNLINSLELDGYIYRYPNLLMPEQDVLNVEQETNLLRNLYERLGLKDKETTLHHLELSEQHYIEGRWDDAISNARKFLEKILSETANTHSLKSHNRPLPQQHYENATDVRRYLEKEGLLEEKEAKAIGSVYGLLSGTGGHPYIAENDQARLLRHLALTFSQFAMLRLEGYLKQLEAKPTTES